MATPIIAGAGAMSDDDMGPAGDVACTLPPNPIGFGDAEGAHEEGIPDDDTPHFLIQPGPTAIGLYSDIVEPGGVRGDSGTDLRFPLGVKFRVSTSVMDFIREGDICERMDEVTDPGPIRRGTPPIEELAIAADIVEPDEPPITELVFTNYGVPSSVAVVDLDIRVRCELRGRFVPYMITPRSSIAKTNLSMANSVGIIDAGYCGNLKVPIRAHADCDESFGRGDSLFQLVRPDLSPARVSVVGPDHPAFAPTVRGGGGFGSTGRTGA